jgi:hypothetical protein
MLNLSNRASRRRYERGMAKVDVLGWFTRLIGYVEADVAKVTTAVQTYAPEGTAILTAITTTEGADAAAFKNHQAVVSPSIQENIDGLPYKITVHFDPV